MTCRQLIQTKGERLKKTASLCNRAIGRLNSKKVDENLYKFSHGGMQTRFIKDREKDKEFQIF